MTGCIKLAGLIFCPKHEIEGQRIIEDTKSNMNWIMTDSVVALLIIIICILFEAAYYTFWNDSSDNYTAFTEEVEAYTPVIPKYCDEYGISEYTELVKAVMMQESGGRGKDPMQASESGYNMKYPRRPNGIKDPEYSNRCGVQAIAGCLKAAKCKDPLDMSRIRLALQGYNYGKGYIPWAVKWDAGYIVENAAAFSDLQAKKRGSKGYGGKQYPTHVLRYYPYGSYTYGISNTKITKVAAVQIGNKGGRKFWSVVRLQEPCRLVRDLRLVVC
jgi:hypothetical protein